MVRSILCVGAVILGLLAALPDDAVAQAKKTKVEQGTAQDYHYMAQTKSFTGQLISFDDSAKTITVQPGGIAGRNRWEKATALYDRIAPMVRVPVELLSADPPPAGRHG